MVQFYQRSNMPNVCIRTYKHVPRSLEPKLRMQGTIRIRIPLGI